MSFSDFGVSRSKQREKTVYVFSNPLGQFWAIVIQRLQDFEEASHDPPQIFQS
jgi:hypothetical protein